MECPSRGIVFFGKDTMFSDFHKILIFVYKEIRRYHCLGTMNIYTKSHSNLASNCQDQSDGQTDHAGQVNIVLVHCSRNVAFGKLGIL